MNINGYKNLMDSIIVKKCTLEELEYKLNKKRQRKKSTFIAMAVISSLLIIAIPSVLLPMEDSFMVAVYAADGQKAELSKGQDHFKLDLFPSMVEYYPESDQGIVNTELTFEFEGEDIDSITLSCSEKIIERDDLATVNAYFTKYSKIKKSVYKNEIEVIESQDNFLGCKYDEDEVTVMTLVGNAYTVEYNEQNLFKYGLTMNVKSNKNNEYSTEELILDIKINHLDGRTQYKKIRIDATDDVLSGINIHLL